MSSPARSSAAASAALSGAAGFPDDLISATASSSSSSNILKDLIAPEDRRDEALAVLKAEIMAALDAEGKNLEKDSWMFDAPRSQMHLVTRPGAFPKKRLRN